MNGESVRLGPGVKHLLHALVAAVLMFAGGCSSSGAVMNSRTIPGGLQTAVRALPAEKTVPERVLERLSLRQKIAQRFIIWLPGTEADDGFLASIRNTVPGGFIFYPWNIVDRTQLAALIAKLQTAAYGAEVPVGLFTALDQEGGRVRALKLDEVTKFPAQFFWGEYDDPAYVEAAAYITGTELARLGFNMNFAPVLDLYEKPDRTIIGDRSLGPDPKTVGRLGTAYLRGARKAGIIPVVKHFPGHGSTTIDSHGFLPEVDMPLADLLAGDGLPFRMAIDAGAEAMMTAHILFRSIDPVYPVTLSHAIIHDVLRSRLGYRGIVVSDGLAMGALSHNFDIRETLKLAFGAGIDVILLHSRYNFTDILNEVESLYDSGEVTLQQIESGTLRILSLKYRRGLIPDNLTPRSPACD